MLDVAVIDDPAVAGVSLDPMRARLLAALTEPASATVLAARVALARPKVNYHLREPERHGLVELVEERRKGNVIERITQATAAAYVISPVVLAAVRPDPAHLPDRLCVRWLLALAARLVQEVGALIAGAARASRPVATFGPDAVVRFAGPADRAAFAHDSPPPWRPWPPGTTTRPRRAAATTASSWPVIRDPQPTTVGRTRRPDMSNHSFEISEEIELAATPEQVWEAIATGPGVDAWFMGHTTVEPGLGGRNSFEMFGSVAHSTVTAWEPGRRFAYREDEAADGTFMAVEFLIEARDGGSAVLRYVHSGLIAGDDWESEYDGLRTGTRMCLAKLAVYLVHFTGRTVSRKVFLPGAQVLDHDRVWSEFRTALGISGEITPGTPARPVTDGREGVVEAVSDGQWIVVRTSAGITVLMHGYADAVVLSYDGFADDRDQAEIERTAQSWLTTTFGPVQPPTWLDQPEAADA
jgi:uncharacterized protein YndB with AHSA1/START domain/DNA-binding transcriptional ArsR family regulator